VATHFKGWKLSKENCCQERETREIPEGKISETERKEDKTRLEIKSPKGLSNKGEEGKTVRQESTIFKSEEKTNDALPLLICFFSCQNHLIFCSKVR